MGPGALWEQAYLRGWMTGSKEIQGARPSLACSSAASHPGSAVTFSGSSWGSRVLQVTSVFSDTSSGLTWLVRGMNK